ncbi:beta-lactamase-like protein [Cokeromyces recurvatus]|uniref:beta-lactamase-like protein n=1 Tax=Cokeromyces recurvatus TaxID=90255 RepID=UPI0022207DA9|nr:beta-lactamase-like protein [Cokeromyces recurvatus]KAI7899847.1 beta-lactamase-like protein [Cokeromyces recurvatus]
MGLNPGKFTLQGTNTYLVGAGNRKVLIDCGDGQPDYVPLLIESLRSIHPEAYISDIIISHCHTDHWGGLPHIMSSKLNQNKSPDTNKDIHQFIKIHKYPLKDMNGIYKHFHKELQTSLPKNITLNDLKDNQLIKVDENTHIQVIHTPGHAKDHCAFYLDEEDTVFTADCILGHGSVAFEDLTEYVHSLNKIQALNPSRLFPGHGDVVNNGMEKIEQYLALRMAKEKQILDLMLKDTSQTWTAIELVEATSLALNREYNNEELIAVVVRAMGLHLIKLYFDGRVEMVDDEKFKKEVGIDPYDANNVFTIVNQKWKYINNGGNSSKL